MLMEKNLGCNIRGIRKERKLTQEQVAELARINPKYLGEIERGLKNPTALIIQSLADALNVRICDIIPAKTCSRMNKKVYTDIARILEGKKEQEQQKALRILEILF